MFSRNVRAAALVCAAFAPASAFAGAYDHLPLEEGNLWVYVTDSNGYLEGPTAVQTIEVKDEAYLGGGWYANKVGGVFSHLEWVYDKTNQDEMWVYEDGWSKFLDFDAPVGSDWTVNAGPCDTFDVSRAPDGGVAVTPAGTFAGVTDFRMDLVPTPNVRCESAGLTSVRTAYGTGIVDFSTNDVKGHLLYARIRGDIAAVGPHETSNLDGLQTTMVLTRDDLTNPHPVYCFTTPCPQPLPHLGAALVVTNTTSATRTLNFASGQLFEFDVWSASGKLVQSWSDDKSFTMATQSIDLAPGESRVFYGTMELNAAGSQLIGDFTVTGYLKSTDSAKHDVDITVHAAE